MASGSHPSRQWENNRSALSTGPSDCCGFRYDWDVSDESPGWKPGNVNEMTQRRDGGMWFFFSRAMGEVGFPSLHFPKQTPQSRTEGFDTRQRFVLSDTDWVSLIRRGSDFNDAQLFFLPLLPLVFGIKAGVFREASSGKQMVLPLESIWWSELKCPRMAGTLQFRPPDHHMWFHTLDDYWRNWQKEQKRQINESTSRVTALFLPVAGLSSDRRNVSRFQKQGHSWNIHYTAFLWPLFHVVRHLLGSLRGADFFIVPLCAHLSSLVTLLVPQLI